MRGPHGPQPHVREGDCAIKVSMRCSDGWGLSYILPPHAHGPCTVVYMVTAPVVTSMRAGGGRRARADASWDRADVECAFNGGLGVFRS